MSLEVPWHFNGFHWHGPPVVTAKTDGVHHIVLPFLINLRFCLAGMKIRNYYVLVAYICSKRKMGVFL